MQLNPRSTAKPPGLRKRGPSGQPASARCSPQGAGPEKARTSPEPEVPAGEEPHAGPGLGRATLTECWRRAASCQPEPPEVERGRARAAGEWLPARRDSSPERSTRLETPGAVNAPTGSREAGDGLPRPSGTATSGAGGYTPRAAQGRLRTLQHKGGCAGTRDRRCDLPVLGSRAGDHLLHGHHYKDANDKGEDGCPALPPPAEGNQAEAGVENWVRRTCLPSLSSAS